MECACVELFVSSGLSLVVSAVLVIGLVTPVEATTVPAVNTTGVSSKAIPGVGELSRDQAARLMMSAEALPATVSRMPKGDFAPLAGPASKPLEVATLKQTKIPDLDAGALAEEAKDLPVAARDEYSTTYERADGSFIDYVLDAPLNVKLSDGEWAPISTNLVSRSGGWRVDTHPLAPKFSGFADATNAVTVTRAGHTLSYGMVGLSAKKGQAGEGDRLLYRQVQPGVDLDYVVDTGSIKETLILAEAPKSDPTWTWIIRADTLTPRMTKLGGVEFLDAKGTVVFTTPTPVAWDSSGVEGESSDALVNPIATLTQAGEGQWSYSIAMDRAWLEAKERTYPVYVDPTIYPGLSYLQSFKSDGNVYPNQAHIGNTRQSNQNVFWRTVAGFNYGAAAGRFIAGAQIGLAFTGEGTTTSQPGGVYYAAGTCFACNGPTQLSGFTISNGDAWTEGTGVAQKIATQFTAGDYGPAFMLVGNEASVYSHKRVDVGMWLDWWSYPVISQQAPAQGATAQSLTPTLSVSSITGSEVDPWKAHHFAVSTSPDMSNPWNSGWSENAQVTVPENTLQPGTTYYWQAAMIDAHNGHLGQSTFRATGVRSFTTELVPPTRRWRPPPRVMTRPRRR